MIQKYLLVAALVTLTGCSTLWKGKSSSSSQGSAASGSTAPQPAQASTTQGSKSSWMQVGSRTPPMDSSRKINEQDCTKGGIDFTAGNLRCK